MIYTPGKFNETFDLCACIILLVLIVVRLSRGFTWTLERRSSIALLLLDVNVLFSAFFGFCWTYMANHDIYANSWQPFFCGIVQKISFASISFLFFLFALFLTIGERPLKKDRWLIYCLPYALAIAALLLPFSRNKIYRLVASSYFVHGPWHWILDLSACLYLYGALRAVWHRWRELGERFWWTVSFEVIYLLARVMNAKFIYLRMSNFLLTMSLLTLTLFIGDFDIRGWREQSVIDELSEIKNRYGFRHDFRYFVDKDLCVAMLDVDHFKDFNDLAGHKCGDEVIRIVGQTGRLFFGNDIYRYGGDEFLIVTNHMTRKQFVKELGRMADSVASAYIDGAPRCVTLTIGYCFGHPQNNQDLRDLLTKADRYLYQGKEGGRRQIVGEKVE